MQFTTVRSKEKDYEWEKSISSPTKVRKTGSAKKKIMTSRKRSTKKMFPSYLEVGKTGSQLFRAWQTLLQLFGDLKKWIPAIRRPKNVVHNCQEQGKRL